MAQMARIAVPGTPHHLCQRGVRSLTIFQSDEDRRFYLEFMGQETKRFRVGILAWCLMTNHALCWAQHKACYVKFAIM